MDDKINLSLGMFESREINAPGGSSKITGQLVNIYNANAAGDPSNEGVNQRNLVLVPTPNKEAEDRFSNGIEFEATANLTDSWRLIANYSEYTVEISAAGTFTKLYYDAHESTLRGAVEDTGAVVENNIASEGSLPEFDEANPAGTASRDRNSAINAWNTMQENLADLTGARSVARESQRINLYTDYRFKEGKLKGFRLGAGVNHQLGNIIGNKGRISLDDPENPGKHIDDPSVDVTDPLFSDDYTKVTANLAYSWKLDNGTKINLRFQIDNLLDDRSVRWTRADARPVDGNVLSGAREAAYTKFAYRTPRRYTLSTSIKF